MVNSIKPDALFCSGWIDKDYLKVCKSYFGKDSNCIMHGYKWKGNVKQTNCFYSFSICYFKQVLWCLGTGDIKPIVHPQIKHFGFVQPSELRNYIEQCGAFVLPSRFEPWGVVVHEYAAAGLPLILSSEVGAKELFLKKEENGFEFEAGNIIDLKEKLKKLFNLSNESLNLMSERSNKLSQQLTIEKWCTTALEIIK
ncbi:MAG: glycosyltransferase [Bacteroidetes bacterium]|nr:glycosyltransferase [Bacteroidota bacterium]